MGVTFVNLNKCFVNIITMKKSHSTQSEKNKLISVNKEEKQKKLEELRLKVKALRDERIAKQTARIQSVRKIY